MASSLAIGLLCYKDYYTSPTGELCYCARSGDENGLLVFKKLFIEIMTEWVFDQDVVGIPYALISGDVVCEGHASEHIIYYDVVKHGTVVNYQDGTMGISFSMSLRRCDKISNCAFRCWMRGYPRFTDAPEDKRAEVIGDTNTVARFEAKIGTDADISIRVVEE